jgi:DNA gyrase subunit B
MGYGNKIVINLSESHQVVEIRDSGRGIPFGIKEDGSNVLVDIFSKAHTGGKFDYKVYNSVAGLNGIGAKATCLSSEWFSVYSRRNGKRALAMWEKGDNVRYEEHIDDRPNGTGIMFKPDPEVYNLEPININFDVLCDKCRNLSYLTKGLIFELNLYDWNISETEKPTKTVVYCAKNGLLDLIKDNANDALHTTPVYYELEDGANKCEVALMWTRGREKSFTFTNGLFQSEGGTSLTGVKASITNFIKKEFKEGFEGDMARTGLVYAVACKTPNPSFANQTKTKINNPELRGLAQRATTMALQDFKVRRANEYKSVIDALTREKKAAAAAERARKQVMEASKDVEKNQKKKVFATDKLKDAEFLGEDSILLIAEGDSAMGGLTQARDYKKYGIMAIKGKIINALSNPEEKIFQNEEIKLLLSAMNIIPGKYDAKKLRYGKLAICTDADADGYHIGLLIMAALHFIAPQFIEEGRLFWLRSPLHIVTSGKTETYYFTDEELEAAKAQGKLKGEVVRNKGLGSLEAEQARKSMFTPEFQRMDPLIPDPDSIILLEQLMGKDILPRRDFVNKIDFSEVRE